jgi:hypothetical protein
LYDPGDPRGLLLFRHGGGYSKDSERFVRLARNHAEQTALAVVCIDPVDHGERKPQLASAGEPPQWHSNAAGSDGGRVAAGQNDRFDEHSVMLGASTRRWRRWRPQFQLLNGGLLDDGTKALAQRGSVRRQAMRPSTGLAHRPILKGSEPE